MKRAQPGEGSASLPEVHGSVTTAHPSLWRRMFAFAGPAYLVSVGYMDPGNWASDLAGGSRFGYQLIWVLVMSNLMAILLQTLSARLGIVTGRDLAQACRESYPRFIAYLLWILCEIAIAACDLAEVLGAAIGLNLLFHIPLLAGVILTALDTLLLLWFSRFGIRLIESIILSLISIIAGCFIFEVIMAKPDMSGILSGFLPTLSNQSLFTAIAILGATVMPHNLYLHSALVQTREIGNTVPAKRAACKFNLIDSVIALNGALLVNAAILILAAAVFFRNGVEVTEIKQAHVLLSPMVGTTLASILFAVALLCAGQSSTITGTMAGQIIMEGFLSIRMRPWLRRLVTRSVAVIPAAITIYIAGDKGTFQLLLLSQVILSLQLPFAVIPLIRFTSDPRRMGSFVNPRWVNLLAWLAAAIIVALNLWLAWDSIREWLGASTSYQSVVLALLIPVCGGLLLLLAWVTAEPFLPHWLRRIGRPSFSLPEQVLAGLKPLFYKMILVPLDHTARDREAISHAASLALSHQAKLVLLHVEEGVTSQVYGSLSSTAEVEAGAEYLESITEALRLRQVDVDFVIRHSTDPRREIVNVAREIRADLVVMGAHGHKGLKDIIFGTTINAVRHDLNVPILVVGDERRKYS
ncbi:MAG: Nramp family divalent metal transporter [Acidobacteria bacterium]|nr:Nramp family divalent metal transporter [Acidobacteriota bacterium]